jgi:outer membrane murein-binding lipoprotein Lpp
MRKLPLLMLTMLSVPAGAQDARVSFLEQEVRNLNRQVQVLTQQVEALRSQGARIPAAAAVPQVRTPSPDLPSWVSAAKWRQLHTGMSELEVVGTLGPPTSMRDEEGARVLLYAMEVGASGFLGGSVTLRERAVVEVRQPVLQ